MQLNPSIIPPTFFMSRALELAQRGAGHVAPNPMVGAVLVFEGRVIGEGYHQEYGAAHAEVNCIDSVKEEDRTLISQSTLYVTLEPCAHHGKTPPCADLIIRNRIPKVVIGCRDPFVEVDGKGMERLVTAGVGIELGVMAEECLELNRRFITFHQQQRPYIILKWAQTADARISGKAGQRLMISNDITNRLVHCWRSEEAAILVGTNTAEMDDPELTNRHWSGPSPVRLVIDRSLRLPGGLRLFDGSSRTIVFNSVKHELGGKLEYYQLKPDKPIVQQILNGLFNMNIQSVLVEGGAKTLQSFIDEGAWDEARIITNTKLRVGEGVEAPVLGDQLKDQEFLVGDDKIEIIRNNYKL